MSPRPRKRSPRKRDYRAEYARRQEAARQRGFASYYERRVAGVPRGERAQARGHRGSRDLDGFLERSGENAVVGWDPFQSRANNEGGWRTVRIVVLTAQGRELEFTLRDPSERRIRALISLIQVSGAVESIKYPISKLLPRGVSEVA